MQRLSPTGHGKMLIILEQHGIHGILIKCSDLYRLALFGTNILAEALQNFTSTYATSTLKTETHFSLEKFNHIVYFDPIMTNVLTTYSFWHQILINLRSQKGRANYSQLTIIVNVKIQFRYLPFKPSFRG